MRQLHVVLATLERRRMLLAPIAVLICSGAVLVELQYGGFARFLADHPLSAGFVSGFLLSLLAWVIVGVVVDSFRESRWEALSAMAFGALQHETTLMIDTLTWLVVGAVPENQARPSASAQRALAQRHDQLLGGPVDAAEMDQHKVPHQLYRCRLTALLESNGWCELAQSAIERQRETNRNGVALWAAAMVSTGELAHVLTRLALLNQKFTILAEWLRTRRGRGAFKALRPSVDRVADYWFLVLAESLSVREDLRRVREELDDAWPGFRRPLPTELREVLEQRVEQDARNLVGRALPEAPPHPRDVQLVTG